MWFGTNDGLNKYDGYQFRVYRNNRLDSTSISNSRIYSMVEDKGGNVWIATRSGLNRYISETNSFKRYLKSETDSCTLSNNFIRRLFIDSKDRLWIGTLGGGLNLYDPQKDRIERIKTQYDPSEPSVRDNGNVYDILEDKLGNIWIANSLNGINLLDGSKASLRFFPFSGESTANENFGKTLYEDRHGNIWTCTEGDGLYCLDRTTGKFRHYYYRPGDNCLSNNIVKDIFEDEKGNLWVATDGGGLDELDPVTGNFREYHYDISNPSGLSSNAIYCLYNDHNGILWIGTFNGGINMYNHNKKAFLHYTQISNNKNSLSHKAVLTFCEDSNHKIWIGTDGGGLNLFDPVNQNFLAYRHVPGDPSSLNSDVVTSILQDRSGKLWVGTYSGGLHLYNPVSGRFKSYQHNPADPNSLGSNLVWTLYEDKSGNFWIGTLNGLYLFDREKETFRHYKPEYHEGSNPQQAAKATGILEDSRGNFWVSGSGLSRFDRITGRFFPVKNQALENYDVRDLYEDAAGNIWIALDGGGLICYNLDHNSFTSYTSHDGLPNDAIHCIIEDDHHEFWLSTNKGISRFNPADGSFRNYDISDGLQSNQFSYAAGLKASTGEIYFGGVNGFNVFYPDSIKDNPYIPQIEITDLKIMNKPVEIGTKNSVLKADISVTKAITLTHSQSVVTFEFTALNYTSPEKNLYKYKMEGFDHDWNEVGTKRTATYTNLDPGKYIFRVKGSNNDGKWNDEGAFLEVNVLPPYWKTFWAFLVYTFILLLMLYSYRNYSIRQQMLKNAIILKDIEKSKVEEVNQLKIRFFTNISHEFRTPLTLIIGPLDKLLSIVKDADIHNQLAIMRKSAGRLLNLVNELMEFRKIETGHLLLKVSRGDIISFIKDIKSAFEELAVRHSIHFTFRSNVDTLEAYFDMEKLDKIISNLLSNAFKCTPDKGHIQVRVLAAPPAEEPDNQAAMNYNFGIPLKDNYIEISVKDSGPGIEPERLPQIFDRFYQVTGNEKAIRNIEQQGTGIGLDLTKDLVLLHHGQIAVRTRQGRGSQFIIRIPQGKEHFKTEEISENLSLLPKDHKFLFSEEDPDTNRQSEFKQEENKTGTKKKRYSVLIVEDQSDLWHFMQDFLRHEFEIFIAEDGLQACDIAYREIPDLIISDIMMPEMDGIELCKELKTDERTNHIPLIFLTAKSTIEARLEGYKTGADDYIPKPFDPDLLVVRIKNLINSRELLKEKFKKEFLLQPREVILESADDKFLAKALEIVEDHISDSTFDVRNFVSEIGMSRSVLYRKLEAVTGQSANEFIRNIRLKRAAQLLSQNKLNVSEISYEVGFNDPQYFSKCFSKQFGKTPSEYAAGFLTKKLI